MQSQNHDFSNIKLQIHWDGLVNFAVTVHRMYIHPIGDIFCLQLPQALCVIKSTYDIPSATKCRVTTTPKILFKNCNDRDEDHDHG